MDRQEDSALSIMEAVEALSTIAEMEFSREVTFATPEEINIQNHMVTTRTIQWVKKEDQKSVEKLIKETFRVILYYLKDFYKNKFRDYGNREALEGVKTIMVVAGEAAKKIDKYTTFFKQTKEKSIAKLKEYRQLQDFYLTRIARKIDDSVLSKWILELTKESLTRREKSIPSGAYRSISTSHVFIDLESVKKDTEYELFFLHKEDGTRFFNPRLIRNIKLVCDFGKSLIGEKEADPFENIKLWQDRALQLAAIDIIKALGSLLDKYIHEAQIHFKNEFVSRLNKTLIALMMASNTKNLISNTTIKSCSEYFQDFLFFLRAALNSDIYQKMIVYSPQKAKSFASCELEVIHVICRALFTHVQEYKELTQIFEHIFKEAVKQQSTEHQIMAEASQTVWSQLAATYAAMTKLMKSHPNGPLIKVLEILQKGISHAYDPICQFNIPNQNYLIYSQETRIINARIPCPIYQESITQGHILEEFKGFLRGYVKSQFHNKHLLINFQDRTSWKEHLRCVTLEQLQDLEEFTHNLIVVTIPKDTEFYHQRSTYEEDKHAESFIKHFKQNLKDENCGFYFPKALQTQLFPKFINEMLHTIHRVFFSHKNVLTKDNRLDFIEIFYILLQLKLIELVHPESFSFVCKDGLDVGGTGSAQLYAFLKLIHSEILEDKDFERINLILYAEPLLVRERIIIPERFNRMLNTLKKIEATRRELGAKAFAKMIQQAFGKFFKTSFLEATVS
jgi:hypothetical protein